MMGSLNINLEVEKSYGKGKYFEAACKALLKKAIFQKFTGLIQCELNIQNFCYFHAIMFR
jgi:hypothetical protein